MRAVAKVSIVRFWGAFLLCACVMPVTPAAYREVWVVNEGTRDIAVIDPAIDAVVERISLGPGESGTPRPWGIAFSTVPGMAGDYAFVTQGSWIRIIDTTTRSIVSTFDLGPSPSITLRGCAAARPERFLAGNGEVAWRSYLHVAAAVVGTDGRLQPWWLVLDQEALIDPPPEGTPIVGSGPFVKFLSPGGMQGEAFDVMVLGAPAGRHQQRAWYSLRFLPSSEGDPVRLVSALVTRPPQLWYPWTVDRLWVADVEEEVPTSTTLGPGAPFDRELPVFPERSLGTLRNVGSGGACGEVGTELVSVTVAGPGPLSYTVLAVDRGPPALVRLDPRTCEVRASQDTGAGPTDVAVLGRIDPERAYVANHDEDTITRVVVSGKAPLFRDPVTIPLDAGGEPVNPCVQCPRSVGVVATTVDSCNIHDLRVEVKDGGLLLRWGAVGCEGFAVWAVCRDGGVDCLPPPWPPPEATIQPWEPALYEGGEPWDGPDFVEARPINLESGPCGGIKGSNGWRPLGKPSDPWFEHDGAAYYLDGDATWYSVLPEDPTLSSR